MTLSHLLGALTVDPIALVRVIIFDPIAHGANDYF